MKKRAPRPTGPMTMQPFDRSATMPAPVLPAIADSASPVVSRPKGKTTRTDAVRDAKARITRRNSLRMQRQAQKG
jgi:hypothetical protein